MKVLVKNLFASSAVFFSLLSSGNAVAALRAPKLEILSFARVSDNEKNVTAEVCGVVTREKKQALSKNADLIRLILDKGTDSARIYYTYAGDTGIFCSLVVTLQGTVEAAIEGESAIESKAISTLSGDIKRH